MEYYSYSDNKILIGHFPGQTKIKNKNLINELSTTHFYLPDNIDIISVITKDQINSSPLHNQLQSNNYKYINPLRNRFMLWSRVGKVEHVLKALNSATKEYSLILDGNDVVILNDLTNIINLLKSYNKKIIYNPTINLYPHVILDNVPNREQYGKYCYLNAGCCFGETEELKNFYEYTYELINNEYNPIDSEQYYIRKAFDKNQDKVFFDYECKIFQCWHKVKYIEKNNKIYVI